MLDVTAPRRPMLLAVSLILVGIIALSVHVGLLALGVPFPLPKSPLWAQWLNYSGIVGGALVALTLMSSRGAPQGIVGQALLLFAIVATIQETLRAAVMEGVVTGGWVHPALGFVKSCAPDLVVAGLCVLAMRRVRGVPALVAAALAIGAVGTGVQRLAGALLNPVMAAFVRGDRYAFPYPAHVTVAAYVTFIEAVVGATLLTMLVWDRLPAERAARLVVLALLVATIKGVIGGTFLFGVFTGPSVAMGMFAWSQFLFEFLTLGALTALAWDRFGAARA